mgnify:CR=1 FL=1
MKVVIIEDEALAAERLTMLVRRYDPEAEILAGLDSVAASVRWFEQHPPPDLCFMDIQLGDGLSFEIFEQTEVNCPVIFTTAYDEYALRAFKVHSIDYLLKPVDFRELSAAFRQFEAQQKPEAASMDGVLDALQQMRSGQRYKDRFLVKSGSRLLPVSATDIAYFFHEEKITWLRLHNGRKYALDYSMEQLTELLDPTHFFRINRQYIVCLDAMQGISDYTNSRLKVSLPHLEKEEEVVVSRERVRAFRAWLGE